MLFRIYSVEHSAWWRENGCGYTRDIKEAGKYTLAEARLIVADANRYVYIDVNGGHLINECLVAVED